MPQDILYITRKNVDVLKYDACISNALNSRIYAYSWYLDIVADDWDVLVLGDYIAVMPLPKRRKYLIAYIYQPAWTQQLGVFSKEIIEGNIFSSFLDTIPKKFKKASIYLNDQNGFENSYSTQRDNYVLDLNSDYKILYQNFTKNRKQSIRKINRDNLKIIEHTNHQNIMVFYYQYIFKKSRLSDADMQNLNALLNHCYRLQKAVTVEAISNENKILGGAVFLKDNNRIYYLFSALSEQGKKEQAMSLIIDYIINKYSGNDIVLDFEGSMIPGIASFFKSFGAKNVPYYVFEKPLSLF